MNVRPLEYCSVCGDPTGKAGAGDGSIYCSCDAGPFCEDCWHDHRCVQKALEYPEQDEDDPAGPEPYDYMLEG